MTTHTHRVDFTGLARLLSDTFNVRVESSGYQAPHVEPAQTDSGTEYVVRIPLPEKPMLPNEAALLRGFIDHEIAHVRYTNFERHKAIMNVTYTHSMDMKNRYHDICNAIEDVRVERKLCRVFPGSRRNLACVSEGIELTRYEHNPLAEAMLYITWMVRQDWDTFTPSQTETLAAIAEDLPWLSDLDDVLREAGQCEGMGEIYGLADKIMNVLVKHFGKSWRDQGGQTSQTSDGQDSQDSDGSAGQNSQSSDGSDGQDYTPWEDMELTGEALACMTNISIENIAITRDGQIRELYNDKLKQQMSMADSNKELRYIPPAAAFEDASAKELQTAHLLYENLGGLFSDLLQAKRLERRYVTAHGQCVDYRLLHRLATSNPRVFRSPAETLGINTEIIVLADVSGSMHGQGSAYASPAVWSVMRTLREIPNTKSCAMAFHSSLSALWDWNDDVPAQYPGRLRTFRDTEMDAALIKVADKFSYDDLTRRIIMVYTDGIPHYPVETKRAIEVLRRSGTEVYNFSFGGDHALQYDKQAKVVMQMRDFPAALYEALSEIYNVEGE